MCMIILFTIFLLESLNEIDFSSKKIMSFLYFLYIENKINNNAGGNDTHIKQLNVKL